MITTNKRTTSETKRVEKFLRAEYPAAELVRPLIHALPEETQLDITMLVLLTEDEKARSAVNLEYEEPSPLGL